MQEKIKEILKGYNLKSYSIGSTEMQVAILTSRINYLRDHFSKHKKDIASRKGLINMVNSRKKLLNYLKKTKESSYQSLIKLLGLRH